MSAVSPSPVAPAPSAPPRPSVLRRVLARVSRVEESVLHDPLVQKDGKALVGALAVRALLAAGASAGTVGLVEAILHAAGV